MKTDELDLSITGRNRGFTLIELLIVIAIIGVLSALLMANFIGIRQRARDAQRKADLRQIQSALELYRSDNSSYPTNAQYPNACGSPLSGGGSTYMEKIPCDPLKSPWVYTYNASGAGGCTAGGYCLFACLENASDSQKDASKQSSCTTASFTVTNP